MTVLDRRNPYSAIPQLEKKFSDLSRYITVEEGKLQIKIDDLYGNVSTLTVLTDEIEGRVEDAEGNITAISQRADRIESRVTSAEGNVSSLTQRADSFDIAITTKADSSTVSALDSELDGEISSRTMLIRAFSGGTITAYQGNGVGVYTNASGSVDIVNLTWSGSTPRLGTTLASYGQTTSIGDSAHTHLEINSNSVDLYSYRSKGGSLSVNSSNQFHIEGSHVVIETSSASVALSSNSVGIYGGGTGYIDVSGDEIAVHGVLSATKRIVGNKIYTMSPSEGSSNTPNARIITAGGTPYEIGFIKGESSRTLKHDIGEINVDDIDPHRLYDADVIQFTYNKGYLNDSDCRANRPLPGFIAEDLYEVYPMAVDVEDGKTLTWNPRYIIPPMLALIQEQNERIKALERRLA